MEDVVKPLMTNDFSNVANTLVIATKPASNKTFSTFILMARLQTHS